MSANQRLAAACAAFSAWMVLLLVGWAAGGLVHVLLVAAVVAFPWRDDTTAQSSASVDDADEDVDEDGDDERTENGSVD